MQPTRFMLCIRHVTPTCIPVVSHRCNMKIIFKVKLQRVFFTKSKILSITAAMVVTLIFLNQVHSESHARSYKTCSEYSEYVQ